MNKIEFRVWDTLYNDWRKNLIDKEIDCSINRDLYFEKIKYFKKDDSYYTDYDEWYSSNAVFNSIDFDDLDGRLIWEQSSTIDGADYDYKTNEYFNYTPIFDGDILEINGVVKPVYFEKGCFMWNGNLLCLIEGLPRPVGNIHENKGLL